MNHDILIMAGAWILGSFINGLTGMGGMLVALPLITMFISAKSVIIVSSMPDCWSPCLPCRFTGAISI